jgi:hypothetical protein
MLMMSHYLDNRLIDGGKVVSPTHQPHFIPRNIIILMFLVLISVRGGVNPRAQCDQKDYLNLKIHLIENRTRDLPVCSIVP